MKKGAIPIRVLSFDQATIKTGWALFWDGEYKISGVFDSSHISKLDRFKKMSRDICTCITQYDPDIVVMEDTVLQRSPAAMKLLSQLQGAIIWHCIGHAIPYVILMPSQWRKQLGFTQGRVTKRKELKQQAQQYVLDRCGASVSEDEADAICIGFAYLQTQIKTSEEQLC